MTKRLIVLLLLTLTVLLSACSAPVSVSTATPTRTPKPAATNTPTPLPASPTPLATATLQATETAEAVTALTPIPSDVNPFTGLKVDDPSILENVPVLIKVSNSPEVRPQSGLSSADIVFEHYAEGGITRFTALFYGNSPSQVGSVRSGRLIDVELPAMFGAIFGYSGSSAGVKDRIRNSDLFPERIAAPDFGQGEPYFYRVPQGNKAFEHTLFSDPSVMRDLAEQRGINTRPDLPVWNLFTEQPIVDGQVVRKFEIPYLPTVCTADWIWDATQEKWLRSIAGAIHTDALTGEQVSADNVVIIYAHHQETDILEDTWGGGHWSIEIQAWGQGRVLLFRDGMVYSGLWTRTERNHQLTFTFDDGTPMPLKPGNSWYQFVPTGTETEDHGDGHFRFVP